MGEDVQSANALERPSANVVLHRVSAVVSLSPSPFCPLRDLLPLLLQLRLTSGRKGSCTPGTQAGLWVAGCRSRDGTARNEH